MRVMTTVSTLKCNECGNNFPIPRMRGKRREVGHVKHMWCVKCKSETPHTENNRDYL